MKYSEKLIRECKIVFKEENGVDLSYEKASEYLDSLGGFYLVFVKKKHVNTPSDTIKKWKR